MSSSRAFFPTLDGCGQRVHEPRMESSPQRTRRPLQEDFTHKVRFASFRLKLCHGAPPLLFPVRTALRNSALLLCLSRRLGRSTLLSF